MDPTKHPSNNKRVRAPADWDDRGGQLKLPVIDVTQGQIAGKALYLSWWKPTKDELMCLIRGGHVQLACIGGQPPVSLCAVDENGASDGLILPH